MPFLPQDEHAGPAGLLSDDMGDGDLVRLAREVERDHATHGKSSGRISAGEWSVTEGGDIFLKAGASRVNLGSWEDVRNESAEQISTIPMPGVRALGHTGLAIMDTVKGVTDAAGRIARGYKPGSGEFGDEMVRDAMVSGPGALLPGFGRAAGGLGAAGGQPPKITALVKAWKGNAEFENLADDIFRELQGVRMNEVRPAVDTLRNSAKGAGPQAADDVERMLQGIDKTQSAEELGKVAERAAAWRLYQKSIGEDFELGALGGKPAARKASHLADAELAEMNDLLRRHPEKADLIRESYGVSVRDAPIPKPEAAPISAVREPPAAGNYSGSRAFTAEELTAIRAAREEGVTYRELAQQYGVDESAIRKRLMYGDYSPAGRNAMSGRYEEGIRDRNVNQPARPGPGDRVLQEYPPQQPNEKMWSPRQRKLSEEQVADVIERRGNKEPWAGIMEDYPNISRASLDELVKKGGYKLRGITHANISELSHPDVEQFIFAMRRDGAKFHEITDALNEKMGRNWTDKAVQHAYDRMIKRAAPGVDELSAGGLPFMNPDRAMVHDSERLREQMRAASDDVPMGRFDFGANMGREDAMGWASFVRTKAGIRALTEPDLSGLDSEPGRYAL